MGLIGINGRVTALGQPILLKDGCIYNWIECEDKSGQIINLSNVTVTKDVSSLCDVGMVGELYFESLGSEKQLFGIKRSDGRVAYDKQSLRGKIAIWCMLVGIPLLFIWGVGILLILSGLTLILMQTPASRKRFFYGPDQQEAEPLRRQVPYASGTTLTVCPSSPEPRTLRPRPC